jgi:hypothetical protein
VLPALDALASGGSSNKGWLSMETGAGRLLADAFLPALLLARPWLSGTLRG